MIITKAKDLVKHTFTMTNGKAFPKKERYRLDRLEKITDNPD